MYLDTSALVKSVLVEPESDAVKSLVRSNLIVTSALTAVELIRAVRRTQPERLLAAREALANAALIPIGDDVINHAGLQNPSSLCSLDAIHLASAFLLGDELEAFVAYDDRLLSAASALGMAVASPGAG